MDRTNECTRIYTIITLSLYVLLQSEIRGGTLIHFNSQKFPKGVTFNKF